MVSRGDILVNIRDASVSTESLLDLHSHVVRLLPVAGKVDCAFLVVVHPAERVSEIVVLAAEVVDRHPGVSKGIKLELTFQQRP